MTHTVPHSEVEDLYRDTHVEAVHLAGDVGDLPRRAAVYHHLYRASGGNFTFALIAAHGALWAHWYLAAARLAARVLAVLDVVSPLTLKQKRDAYDAYIGALREINASVMTEAYTVFQFTRRHGRHPLIREIMPDRLLDQLIACHDAAKAGVPLTVAQQRWLYEDFFRWEQDRVAGPAVDAALAEFNWALMRNLCLRPWVWFSYFRIGRSLNFRNFSNVEERVQKGLAAFDLGARRGWRRIERNLIASPFMPRGFSDDPEGCFEALRNAGIHPVRKHVARLEARLVSRI